MSAVTDSAPRRKASTKRVVVLTLGAFALYGGWAFFVNYAHGAAVASRALLAQGTSSGVSTLVLSALVEWILARRQRWLVAALAPPTATGGMHILGHVITGTPRLWTTVSVPIAMGFVFASIYVLGVNRAARTSR